MINIIDFFSLISLSLVYDYYTYTSQVQYHTAVINLKALRRLTQFTMTCLYYNHFKIDSNVN